MLLSLRLSVDIVYSHETKQPRLSSISTVPEQGGRQSSTDLLYLSG